MDNKNLHNILNSRKTNHRSVISKTFSLVILDVNLDFGKCVWDNTTYASRQMFKAIEQVRNTSKHTLFKFH